MKQGLSITCEAEAEVRPWAVAFHDEALLVVQRIKSGAGARKAPAHFFLHSVIEGFSLLLFNLCRSFLFLGRGVLNASTSS